MSRGAHVVVVGSGLAGARTCLTLRDLGFDGDVTLLGDEEVVAYSKPPLSKSYQLAAEPTVVQLHEAHELEDAGVRVELGTEVAGVDLANRSLVTSAHQTFDFSELVARLQRLRRR